MPLYQLTGAVNQTLTSPEAAEGASLQGGWHPPLTPPALLPMGLVLCVLFQPR